MSEKSKKPEVNVYKVVLSATKVAYLKEPLISHTELAAKMIGKKGADNNLVAGVSLQSALLKILLYQIDDKVLSHADKNDLDKILSLREYNILLKVIRKLTGDDEAGEEKELEMVFL